MILFLISLIIACLLNDKSYINKDRRKVFIISAIILMIIIVSILLPYYFNPFNLTMKLENYYKTLVFRLIIYFFIWVYLLIKKDIYESIVLITLVHVL